MDRWSLPPRFEAALARLGVPIHPAPASPAAAPSAAMPADQLSLASQPAPAGKIRLDSLNDRYIKDPSFVNGGAPVGDRRYIAFGNLHQFFLKPFTLGPAASGEMGLAFGAGEIPVSIKGLPAGMSGLWAPQVVVQGDRVRLFYCAGRQDRGIDWPSFRLRMAEMPLADFEAQAKAGHGVAFQDAGTLFDDQTTFGGSDRNFAMIDPHYYVTPAGRAFFTYAVVQPAVPGQHGWQEFVRSREVSPSNPMQAIGPDTPVVDGFPGGRHQGVAEAPCVVTINGKPTLFVSSRAGDKDQRILAAPIGPDMGRVADRKLKPVMTPGHEPWASNALGSNDAMAVDGRVVMLYQGMDKRKRFSLGWQTIPAPH